MPARAGHQGLGGCHGLFATDGVLHIRIEILHTNRDARKAQAGEGVDMSSRGHARIHFDGALGVGQKREMALETPHQPNQLVGIQIGRRAAAQVVLRHLAAIGQEPGHALHLDFEMCKVGLDDVVAGCREGVAAAEPAAFDAEGNVRVDRKRRLAQTVGRGQRGPVFRIAIARVKINRRRVRGVPRSDGVVAGK